MRLETVMTRKRFRAWLSSKSPRKVVGKVWGDDSPLDRYAHESGFPKARVYGNFWYPGGIGRGIELPGWARLFQLQIGLEALEKGPATKSVITTKRALSMI